MRRLPTYGAPLVLLSPCASSAQIELWRTVDLRAGAGLLSPAHLTRARRASIRKLLSPQPAPWECGDGDGDTSWQRNLTFSEVPLAPRRVTLVEAGAGCARGGQGSNGAMWLISWTGAHPELIASPKQLSGWFRSVEPRSAHRFHDITIGWHMSASESGLTYLRFNGRSYQAISSADVRIDDSGAPHIIETKPLPSPR